MYIFILSKYIMYIQDYIVLYKNTISPIICEVFNSRVQKASSISLRTEVWVCSTGLTRHFLLKCLSQTSHVSGHIFMCMEY